MKNVTAEHPDETSYFLITRRDARHADVLILKLSGGEMVLPVFSLGEEAGMFLWLEALDEGWQVEEFYVEELVSLLCDTCAGVERVAPNPFAATVPEGRFVTVDRRAFLRTLAGERASLLARRYMSRDQSLCGSA